MSNKAKEGKVNTHGFTLIEVVVALGIMMITLAGAVTLFMVALNLAMATRDKTEATALMQKGLADATTIVQSCCNAGTFTAMPGYTGSGPFTYTSGAKTLTVTLNTGSFTKSSTPVGQSITNADFIEVTSHVSWSFRGTPYNITTYQYMRGPK